MMGKEPWTVDQVAELEMMARAWLEHNSKPKPHFTLDFP
jgi:hypothetical protein